MRKLNECHCTPPPTHRQRGVVLLVVLLFLLLTTIVGFSAMQTSGLEAKMAAARLGREVSFQAAESALDQVKNDQAALVAAFIAGQNPASPPTVNYSYSADADLAGVVETRYVDEIPALGNDIVIGSSGLRSLHFDLRATVRRANDEKFDSIHRQGIKRFAPKLP